MVSIGLFQNVYALGPKGWPTQTENYKSLRSTYFGGLHIHMRNSFDVIFNIRTTPDDAHRYAKGETVSHPAGYKVRLQGRSLDFMVATSHTEFMGILLALANPHHKLARLPLADQLISKDMSVVDEVFQTIGRT